MFENLEIRTVPILQTQSKRIREKLDRLFLEFADLENGVIPVRLTIPKNELKIRENRKKIIEYLKNEGTYLIQYGENEVIIYIKYNYFLKLSRKRNLKNGAKKANKTKKENRKKRVVQRGISFLEG